MAVLDRQLADVDADVYAAVRAELERQQSTLEMIASENFAPVAVMQAQGSVLTNKYAEGYPGRRYYGGRGDGSALRRAGLAAVLLLSGLPFSPPPATPRRSPSHPRCSAPPARPRPH